MTSNLRLIREGDAPGARSGFSKDFMASIVVFLVALPLCMGIAIASGVPPALGLITGIVGGLVVGFIAGQPLQVSGPAAGLAVMVWQLVEQFGIAALGIAVFLAGVIQLGAGVLGLGKWFRAVSPAVIQGMLAGIGVLIFSSQFHVMMDAKPAGDGLTNFLTIPLAAYKGIFTLDGNPHHLAAAIGLLTIGGIVYWNKYKPAKLKMIPGPLVGVVAATAFATVLGFPIAKVVVPENLADSINWITGANFGLLTQTAFWGSVIGLAVIASAETLLCATAVDRMHDGQRTHYDKELRAQGIGNILCGVFGALPMTGVIVRSSANVEAGGKTKWSAIMHGAWILGLVALAPQILALIPTASLAAILVYTGVKLLGIPAAKALYAKGKSEFAIWAATVATIVATDLLIGVMTGFALALAKTLFTFAKLNVHVENKSDHYEVHLEGAATFVSLPKLASALESLPQNATVRVMLDRVAYIDHACMELVESWMERHLGEVDLELAHLQARGKPEVVYATAS
jgi:MFS superfamily sulfate permease-like transporter